MCLAATDSAFSEDCKRSEEGLLMLFFVQDAADNSRSAAIPVLSDVFILLFYDAKQ